MYEPLGGCGDGHQPDPDLRREGADVDGHDVDQPDLLGLELRELVGAVAPSENAGVYGRVKGLDLGARDRLGAGEVGDGTDDNPFGGQRQTRPVGGDDIDAEGEQVSCERNDALPVSHREQGSHQAYLPKARIRASSANLLRRRRPVFRSRPRLD